MQRRSFFGALAAAAAAPVVLPQSAMDTSAVLGALMMDRRICRVGVHLQHLKVYPWIVRTNNVVVGFSGVYLQRDDDLHGVYSLGGARHLLKRLNDNPTAVGKELGQLVVGAGLVFAPEWQATVDAHERECRMIAREQAP